MYTHYMSQVAPCVALVAALLRATPGVSAVTDPAGIPGGYTVECVYTQSAIPLRLVFDAARAHVTVWRAWDGDYHTEWDLLGAGWPLHPYLSAPPTPAHAAQFITDLVAYLARHGLTYTPRAAPPEITTPFQRALYSELGNVAAVQRAETALRAVPHTATGWRDNAALRAALRAAGFTPVQGICILSAWQRYGG